MRTFDVFQQHPPKGDRANLQFVGRVKAVDGKDAINKAKKWKQFRHAANLGKWPVVEDTGRTIKRQIAEEQEVINSIGTLH